MVAMDFERLSSNLVAIIDEILKNQKLVNYIGYDGNDPESKTISPQSIAPKGINERIFPYPFDVNFRDSVRTQLHIYYPHFTFENNSNASRVAIVFDIVVNKSIWLVSDGGRKLIRPYQIAKYIIDTFRDKHIDKVGKIHFIEGSHTIINDEFDGLRLVAQFTEF
jgi:hypothetical protein